MTHKLCPQTGKRQYKRGEADRAVTFAGRDIELAHMPCTAYRCTHCHKWHLSGMSRLEYQVRELMRGSA